MRQVILDTETSGLTLKKTGSLIGCLELVDGIFTEKNFITIINLTTFSQVLNQNKFMDLTTHFFPILSFDSCGKIFKITGRFSVNLHNVQFDLSMINQSLKRMSIKQIDKKNTICTLN